MDIEKYKKPRFRPRLLKRCENGVQLGKPEDIIEDLTTAVNTPKKVFPGAETENRNKTDLEEQPNISFNVTSLPGPSIFFPNSVCQNSYARPFNFFHQLSAAEFELQCMQGIGNETRKCTRPQMGSCLVTSKD